MFKSILLSWTLLLCCIVSSYANAPDISLNYISKAACRVSAGPNRGSGVAVHKDKEYLYILTNAHVVENYSAINVEFYRYGVKTSPLPGSIKGKVLNADQDFAIIAVDIKYFGKFVPETIPLAPPEYFIKPNTYFATAGNPFSRDMTAREGVILREEGSRIIFTPPPDQGQSGSGLFVRVGEKVYVAGIITFKSGEYSMDVNGYPTTYGAAFNINRLRTNLQKTSKYDKILYPVVDKLYALGSDGKYYVQSEDGSVLVPPGIQITQWNCPDGQCAPPKSNMVPLPAPSVPRPAPRTTAPPTNNPFPTLPEGFGEAVPPTEEPKVDIPLPDSNTVPPTEPNNECAELKIKYEALLKEVEVLKVTLAEKEQSILNLEKKIQENLLPPINLDDYKKEMDELRLTITQKNQEIEKYKIQISALQEFNNNQVDPSIIQNPPAAVEAKPGILDKIKEGASNLHPIWWGLLGVGGTLLFGKYKALAAIPGFIGSLWAKGTTVDKVIKSAPELSEITKWLNEKFTNNDAKLSGLTDYLTSKLDDISNKNVVNNNINVEATSTANDEDAEPLDFKKMYAGKPVGDRIKQFFDLKKKDGDSIEKWAFFALLYREAMQLLRRGQFELDVVGNKVTLQGQRLAADRIDNWVREQFLKRTTIDKLDYNYLYHEAMIGFLYREAVKLLRLGHFPVLGAKETANVIENWVKQEFLDRMGITL
jgi:hypothetical protein